MALILFILYGDISSQNTSVVFSLVQQRLLDLDHYCARTPTLLHLKKIVRPAQQDIVVFAWHSESFCLVYSEGLKEGNQLSRSSKVSHQ